MNEWNLQLGHKHVSLSEWLASDLCSTNGLHLSDRKQGAGHHAQNGTTPIETAEEGALLLKQAQAPGMCHSSQGACCRGLNGDADKSLGDRSLA